MSLTWAFTLLFGFASVLQSGLNREISKNFGLTGAVWMNSLVLTVVSSIILILARSQMLPDHPVFLQKGNWPMPLWWYVMPGLLGLFILFGLPYSFMSWGALVTVLGMVVGQILFGMLWDVGVEHRTLAWNQIAGSVLALLGVFLVNFKR